MRYDPFEQLPGRLVQGIKGMKNKYLWFALLSLIWPLLQILFFYFRFQRLPDNVLESFYFLPMGMISAYFVLTMMTRAEDRTTRVSTAVGYLVACPIAAVLAIGGGLAMHPLLGATLFGSLPLVGGTAVGYGMGRLVANDTPEETG